MKNRNYEKEILELRCEKKYGYKKIAKILGVSLTYVSDVLINNGITSHVIMPDEETVSKIIFGYCVELKGTKKLAKQFQISEHRIRSILKVKGIKINPSAYHSGYENKIDHFYFSTIDSEHKAYWLGFLYADGYNNESNLSIELTLKKEDRYMLEQLQQDLKTIYKISDKQVTLNNKIFWCSRIVLYSKQISNDLKNKGCCQTKSLILNFPSEDIIPKYLVHHFMRGYFDGDGCISGSKFMINGTKEFLDIYIKHLWEDTTISHKGTFTMDGKAYRWQHAAKRDIPKIYNFLYQDATIYLKRKCDRFLIFK